jgi:hypothetical protein
MQTARVVSWGDELLLSWNKSQEYISGAETAKAAFDF